MQNKFSTQYDKNQSITRSQATIYRKINSKQIENQSKITPMQFKEKGDRLQSLQKEITHLCWR